MKENERFRGVESFSRIKIVFSILVNLFIELGLLTGSRQLIKRNKLCLYPDRLTWKKEKSVAVINKRRKIARGPPCLDNYLVIVYRITHAIYDPRGFLDGASIKGRNYLRDIIGS